MSVDYETQKFTFNLLTEPWIPLEDSKGGQTHFVSVRKALLNANEFKDLQCEKPTTTVSILRLLRAIIYRACPVRTAKEWAIVWKAGQLPTEKISDYLDKWEHKFDLFSRNHPFLQIAGLQSSTPGIQKLAAELGTESNKLLFEWESGNRMHTCSPAHAARLLLEIQCFGLAGGISGKVQGVGIPEDRPRFKDGTVARGISIWFTDDNFFKTLWLNTLPITTLDLDDIPAWEQDKPLEFLEEPALGPIDRLIWQSRLVRLEPIQDIRGETVVHSIQFTQGRPADTEFGTIPDLMGVYHMSKEHGVVALKLDKEKASWRDLHAMLAFEKFENQTLRWVGRAIEQEIMPQQARYNLNVMGMVTDQASVSLWRHDRMSVPAKILSQPDRIGDLATVVNDAEFVADEMKQRLSDVVKCFLQPNGKPDRKDVDRFVQALDSQRPYWARLEPHFAHFIFALADNSDAAVQEWRKAVEDEAKRALQASCTQLGHSARAIRATAQISYTFLANKAIVEAQKAEKRQKEKAMKTKASATKKGEIKP
jgi:CRISPR system Cascade subunit CasA